MKTIEKKANFVENLWINPAQQNVRFEITNKFLIDNETLIDVGCGTLDLPKYLINKGRIFNYLGIESNRNLAAKNSQLPFQVIYADIIKENIVLPRGDIVVAWGVTAYFDDYKRTRKYDVLSIFISRLIDMAERLVLFDTWNEDRFYHKPGIKDEGISYFQPQKVIDIIHGIDPNIQIIVKLPLDRRDPEADLFILNLQ